VTACDKEQHSKLQNTSAAAICWTTLLVGHELTKRTWHCQLIPSVMIRALLAIILMETDENSVAGSRM
jgi:hypothetical protein